MALSKIETQALDVGQIGGRRNLIINGAYTIWQRATTSSSNGVKTADRWQQNDATFTQETSIVPDNFQYSMKVVANGSGTPLLLQKIERPQVCGHVLNQDITVSFYARSSNVNAITKLELNDEGGSGGRPDGGAQTLSAADTWERITHTFTAPFSSLTGNSVAVILTFATSATVYISGFQVEVGSVATPFEHRSYGEELLACYRYYYKLFPELQDSYCSGSIYAYSTSNAVGNGMFPVKMRVAPTAIDLSAATDWNLNKVGGYNRNVTGLTWGNTTNTQFYNLNYACSSNDLTSAAIHYLKSANANAYIAWSAEL
jgi:hypothetical protein